MSRTKAKPPKPLCEEIINFIHARYIALSVSHRQRTPTAQSVLKLSTQVKIYDHYTADTFWASWLVRNAHDFRNILPSPDSRFTHMRKKGIKLLEHARKLIDK